MRPGTSVVLDLGRSAMARDTPISDPPCLHSAPRCMIAQPEFRVTIVVRG